MQYVKSMKELTFENVIYFFTLLRVDCVSSNEKRKSCLPYHISRKMHI